ncbi:lactoylglutathione lyase [Streptomyces sp. CB02923]|uniref:VOC family protein n=1 Tax=Streptomyces sp. CB02923 TaxID=1718985 RepID=UPI00093CED6D|nr:VOC family protein [Streptomyces sp. CB02923]OKI02709.1 lactoylglutathione lyase [Streptomyces sp. CB02923]
MAAVTPSEMVMVLDCADREALAEFWSQALGYRIARTSPPYTALTDPEGRTPELLLQEVPEPKRGKNRMHIDLRVPAMEPALGRVVALGARVLRGPSDDAGTLTTVLADPEGNEFCLIVFDGA